MRVLLLKLLLLPFIFSSQTLASNLIPLEATFSPGSDKTEVPHEAGGVKRSHGFKEEGVREGIQYRFYHSDGSGRFAGDKNSDFSWRSYRDDWSLECKKDIMTDVVWCRADKGNLVVFYSPETDFLVSLSGDKYPGSLMSIRVDDGRVVSANEKHGFTKQQSREVLKSIKDGSKVATRYVDWPYNKNTDKVLTGYGLKQVMDYMLWVQEVAQ